MRVGFIVEVIDYCGVHNDRPLYVCINGHKAHHARGSSFLQQNYKIDITKGDLSSAQNM